MQEKDSRQVPVTRGEGNDHFTTLKGKVSRTPLIATEINDFDHIQLQNFLSQWEGWVEVVLSLFFYACTV